MIYRLVFMMTLGVLWLAGTDASPAFGQTERTATSGDEQREAMKPFSWLIGEWAGEGWIARGPEGRFEFTQTEHVASALGDRLLLVEGIGRTRASEGEGPIVHHAYGVLSWNGATDGYRFDTYRVGDRGVDAEAALEEGGFTWGFDAPTGRVRFRIRHTENDEWHETGEFSPDQGATWHPFFEMRLHRIEGEGSRDAGASASGGRR